jgi:hypothetical protein
MPEDPNDEGPAAGSEVVRRLIRDELATSVTQLAASHASSVSAAVLDNQPLVRALTRHAADTAMAGTFQRNALDNSALLGAVRQPLGSVDFTRRLSDGVRGTRYCRGFSRSRGCSTR